MSNKLNRLLFPIVMFCFIIVTTLTTSCSTKANREQAREHLLITKNVSYYYDLENPNDTYSLPKALEEISGLTYFENQKILCLEDEHAIVYQYDLSKKEVTHTINFGAPGDFEGIEFVNNVVYTLQSDGSLFSFAYTKDEKADAEKYETELDGSNNTEGLGYNRMTGDLLIACKEDGSVADNNADGKVVYAFDPKTNKLVSSQPFFNITADHLKKFFAAHGLPESQNNLNKFKPSAIAQNPLDENFYLLASSGRILLVLNKEGEIIASYPVDGNLLGQPEGICFAPDGDLFICSEGNPGYIVRYTSKRK